MFRSVLALSAVLALASPACAVTFDIAPNSDATFDVPFANTEIQFTDLIISGDPSGGAFHVDYQYYVDPEHSDFVGSYGDYVATTSLQYDAVDMFGYPFPGYDGYLYFSNTTGA